MRTGHDQDDNLLVESQEELSLDAGSGCRQLHHDIPLSEEGSGLIEHRTFGMSAKMKMRVVPGLPRVEHHQTDDGRQSLSTRNPSCLTKTTSLWSIHKSLGSVCMLHNIFRRIETSWPEGDFLASKIIFMTGFVKCCHSDSAGACAPIDSG